MKHISLLVQRKKREQPKIGSGSCTLKGRWKLSEYKGERIFRVSVCNRESRTVQVVPVVEFVTLLFLACSPLRADSAGEPLLAVLDAWMNKNTAVQLHPVFKEQLL